jgi:hypothetical protein
MKRLVLGIGIGIGLAYGWNRLLGTESEPQPSWTGTDNDPEDLGSVEDDLIARTRQPEEARDTIFEDGPPTPTSRTQEAEPS